jgi:hypothetical protein
MDEAFSFLILAPLAEGVVRGSNSPVTATTEPSDGDPMLQVDFGADTCTAGVGADACIVGEGGVGAAAVGFSLSPDGMLLAIQIASTAMTIIFKSFFMIPQAYPEAA